MFALPEKSIAFLYRNRFIALCVGAMVVCVYGWCTRWTFDPSFSAYIRSDSFFTAQADALIRGRLWVDPKSMDTVLECFYSAGKCYGYFGLPPSRLRVPILLVIGPTTQSFAIFMIPLAAG